MEKNLLVPTILFATAVLELVMLPFITSRLKGPNKVIVGGAMFMGALITGAIGGAFWMGWL